MGEAARFCDNFFLNGIPDNDHQNLGKEPEVLAEQMDFWVCAAAT